MAQPRYLKDLINFDSSLRSFTTTNYNLIDKKNLRRKQGLNLDLLDAERELHKPAACESTYYNLRDTKTY